MFAGMTLLLAVTAEAAEEAAKSEGLPQLNPDHFTPQLFWLAVTFLILLFVMQKIALPRVGEVIEERRDRIKRDIDAATRLKIDTDRALADYEKRDSLAAETDAERHRVDAQIAAKLQGADARIAQTKSKAVTAIGDIAADTARAVVAKLIGQDISPDEVKKVLRPAPGE
jgi:F-type H+-transporting ATPase subunit b